MSPFRNHLNSSNDLVTAYEAIRAGFVALTLEKNRKATPYVSEARALQRGSSAKRPSICYNRASNLALHGGRLSRKLSTPYYLR